MLSEPTQKTENPKNFLSNLLKLDKNAKNDTFSTLLQSFSFGKADKNAVLQDLPKGLENLDLLNQVSEQGTKESASKSPLAQLFDLGKEGASDEEQFHPDVLKALPTKDTKQAVQQLIGEAKEYLKEQISLKADVKEMPKTLGGLIKLAEKSGIDVKAISFESLSQASTKGLNLSELAKSLTQESPTKPNSVSQAIPHTTSEIVKPSIVVKNEKDSNASKPLNILLKNKGEESSTQNAFLEEVVDEDSTKVTKAPVLSASLSALLHGEEKAKKTESELSPRVEGDKSNEKASSITQAKTDQLSQKINEAKQLVQHMAQSVKESVENYKPPFTRIKMQLNPQKFGEMDVTLVQRGNNVHININANSTALTVMMQNSHELKAALSAQGLGDASMNFSSQQQQQNQEQQQQENAYLSYEEYQEFENELTEVATALEIVVPRYI